MNSVEKTVPSQMWDSGTLEKSVLNVEVSIWPNYFTSDAPKTVNLLKWLTSTKYRHKVEQIRTLPTKSDRDALKATLPAITVSGLFSERRAKASLTRHSGLIALDFDEKDNRHITNFTDLRAQLCKVPNVAYCGLSVSGTGFFAIIRIAHPDRHEQHFDALKRLFWDRWQLRVDAACRDVSRLRGYSYDANGFFRHDAVLFRLFDEPHPKPIPRPASSYRTSGTNNTDESQLLKRIVDMVKGLGEGNRHIGLLKAARLAGGFIAANRMSEGTAVCALETVASEWPAFSKSQGTIRDGIRYGVQKPLYAEDFRPSQRWPIPQPTAPVIVRTLAEWLAQPGSICRPDESQIERLIVDSCDDYPNGYPPSWDQINLSE